MSKSVKFLVAFLMFVCLGFVFSACGTEEVAPRAGGGSGGDMSGFAVVENVSDLRVGFSIKNRHNPYLIAMYDTMWEMQAQMGFQLHTRNAGGDMMQQHIDVESLLAVGVDVIIMDAQDPIAAIATSELIASHGIPLFLMNAGVDPASIFVTLVQSNNVGLGSAVGEWIADQISGEIRIGMLSGNPGNMVGFARRNGFIQGISERQLARDNSTSFNVLTHQWGNWSAELGLTATEDMLVAAPSINVIFAENDAMAMGAITAVQNAGRADDVIIVGIDGMRTALEMIQEGSYGATGVNSPIELVRLTMGIVVDYMTGVNRNVPALINTTPGIVHIGNLAASWDLSF
jgi:ribose transport system substrate-binding protein